MTTFFLPEFSTTCLPNGVVFPSPVDQKMTNEFIFFETKKMFSNFDEHSMNFENFKLMINLQTCGRRGQNVTYDPETIPIYKNFEVVPHCLAVCPIQDFLLPHHRFQKKVVSLNKFQESLPHF